MRTPRTGRRPLGWSVWGLGVAVLAVGLLLVTASGPDRIPPWANELAGIGSFLIAIIGLVISLASWRTIRTSADAEQGQRLDRACAELAREVSRQWEREAAVRGLLHPEPLRVRWSKTGRQVTEPDPAERRSRSRHLRGDVRDVAGKWRQLPTGQLVVIGEPGAGKTSLAVLFVCRLAVERQPNDPVPVLLSLSDWNPSGRDFHAWLAERLAVQYLVPTEQGRHRLDLATRLVDDGRVLPVLDGLDEMPSSLRPAAVRALNAAMGRNRPLVLTCRVDEYEQTITSLGTPLAAAAVVEMEPLTWLEAAQYLPTGQLDGKRRWAGVVRHLRARPNGALAQALATPLMVYLARTAYSPPGRDPADLVGFTDVAAVRQHLLQAYLPTVYAHRPPGPQASGTYRCTPEQAERWLVFLARHLELNLNGTTEIGWWELRSAAPAWLVGAALGVGPAIAIAIGTSMIPKTGIGVGLGLLIGLSGVMLARRLRGAPGGNWVLAVAVSMASTAAGAFLSGLLGVGDSFGTGPTDGLSGALGVGLAIGPVGGLLPGASAGFVSGVIVQATAGVAPGLVAALLNGIAGWLTVALLVIYRARDLPAHGLRGLRWTPLSIATALAAGLVIGVADEPIMAPLGVLVGLALGLLVHEASISTANPRTLLARDRNVFLVATVVTGAAVTVGVGRAVGEMAIGIAAGITTGLVFGCLQAAWGTFTVARSWLALRGQVPWRLLSFLADAHEQRGVLRQVGAIYQFRHAELQHHLAGVTQPPPAPDPHRLPAAPLDHNDPT